MDFRRLRNIKHMQLMIIKIVQVYWVNNMAVNFISNLKKCQRKSSFKQMPPVSEKNYYSINW